MPLPAGATTYNKRPVPTKADGLPDFLTRELNIIDRAIKSATLSPTRAVTASLTPSLEDEVLCVDASAGAVILTLPDVRRASGKRYDVKKTDASGNTVTVSSPANIDGATTYVISVQYASVTVVSDGATWWVL